MKSGFSATFFRGRIISDKNVILRAKTSLCGKIRHYTSKDVVMQAKTSLCGKLSDYSVIIRPLCEPNTHCCSV